jgi:hypothetical protein
MRAEHADRLVRLDADDTGAELLAANHGSLANVLSETERLTVNDGASPSLHTEGRQYCRVHRNLPTVVGTRDPQANPKNALQRGSLPPN